MILVADSGATKISWRAIGADGQVRQYETEGISAIFGTDESIRANLQALADQLGEPVAKVWFYGAGLVGGKETERVLACLQSVFAGAECETASDLIAAARALCGRKPGFACIMGTGSNTCFYDGEKIAAHVNSGGYIIGDEGSGADLGKTLISNHIKGMLPAEISRELLEQHGLDYMTVVSRVYREQYPSKFLASFAPYIASHMDHPYIKQMVMDRFKAFLERNIAQYEDCRSYPVNFVGGVAWSFRESLEEAVREAGMIMGTIMRGPIDALVQYHKDNESN